MTIIISKQRFIIYIYLIYFDTLFLQEEGILLTNAC